VPIVYLAMQQIPQTKALAQQIGDNVSGLLTYALVALAMIIGSLLKPAAAARPTGTR